MPSPEESSISDRDVARLRIQPRSPEGLLWVKSGKARPEHLLSAIPPKADFARSLRDVRFVPIPDIGQPIAGQNPPGLLDQAADAGRAARPTPVNSAVFLKCATATGAPVVLVSRSRQNFLGNEFGRVNCQKTYSAEPSRAEAYRKGLIRHP
jgi:hypothetical protein